MERIFVTGFLGSRKREEAERISAERGLEIIELDKEIEKKKNMTVRRLSMMMGEHGLRNEEYEMLRELKDRDGIVVICSDGIVFDDMCVELLREGTVVIADAESGPDELFARAKCDKELPYAFMMSDNEEEKYRKFCEMFEQRKSLYGQFI